MSTNTSLRTLFFLLAGICSVDYASAGDKLRIVMKAFIPSSVPGSIDLLPMPGFPGRFMLKGPLNTCFETDNRTFSTEPTSSARITTDFTIDVVDPPTVAPAEKAARFKTGVTHRVNCLTGAAEASGQADAGCTMGTIARTDRQVQVVTACSVANPLLPAPAIDYGGSFIYDLRKFTLSFEGDVGSFPSFEIYASLNGGPFVTLLARAPLGAAGPVSLYDLWLHINTHRIVIPPTKLYKG